MTASFCCVKQIISVASHRKIYPGQDVGKHNALRLQRYVPLSSLGARRFFANYCRSQDRGESLLDTHCPRKILINIVSRYPPAVEPLHFHFSQKNHLKEKKLFLETKQRLKTTTKTKNLQNNVKQENNTGQRKFYKPGARWEHCKARSWFFSERNRRKYNARNSLFWRSFFQSPSAG